MSKIVNIQNLEEFGVYTLEIRGTPIALINAPHEEADNYLLSDEFKENLLVLEEEGLTPLLHEAVPLSVRRASLNEIENFERCFAADVKNGILKRGEEKGFVVFLIPVRDPTYDN
jgi:hypothetical protein